MIAAKYFFPKHVNKSFLASFNPSLFYSELDPIVLGCVQYSIAHDMTSIDMLHFVFLG